LPSKQLAENTLFYGDNLSILRDYIPDESVDLVYLDPPFNSNRSYNVLFRDEVGKEASAQIQAFEDTWHWNRVAEETYDALVTEFPDHISSMIVAMRQFIGTNQMMAYLVMMAVRLVELHRVLKPTGSLYLHCDPTASHYLKIILDGIFGVRNHLNEITWKRSSAHSDTKQGMERCGRIRDILLLYRKTSNHVWNPQYTPYTEDYLEAEYRHISPDGRHYKETDLTAAKPGGDTEYDWFVKRPIGKNSRWQADLEEEFRNPVEGWEYQAVRPYNGRFWAYSKENLIEFARTNKLIHRKTGMPRVMHFSDEMPGVPLQDLWTDIPPVSGSQDLGYPTQKPLALLERIVQMSSNPGDIVLDPFAGCGTAIAAAQKLGRRWIGIDITHLAVALQRYRFEQMYPGISFKVIGEPQDIGSARQLAQEDRYQFQWWALSLIRARPFGGEVGSKQGKKGSDKGIDGVINFIDDRSGKPKRVLVQVKSGNVKSGDIRDLVGTVEREKAEMGVFITLLPPSSDMKREAVSTGFYRSPLWKQNYPKVQILTVEELLHGAKLDMPQAQSSFKQAGRADQLGVEQLNLDI
jgi:DNA modification methylase